MAKKTRGIFLRKSAEEIEAHVARVLFDLEMPNYFKGYLYLKDAIYMAVLDENMYALVTKDLYEKSQSAIRLHLLLWKRHHTQSAKPGSLKP